MLFCLCVCFVCVCVLSCWKPTKEKFACGTDIFVLKLLFLAALENKSCATFCRVFV